MWAHATVTVYACACMCVAVWAHGRVHVHVALLIMHAMHMCHIVSFVAFLAPPHFSILSLKWYDFWENVTEHKMCVFILSNIPHYKTNLARYCHKCENVPMQSTCYSCQI